MTTQTAADGWARSLADWSIPGDILARAPQNPWAFPTDLFQRRAAAALDAKPTPSALRALEGLGSGGTVLDVGAGGGAAAFAIRSRMSHLTAIDSSADALAGLRKRARGARVRVDTVLGSWPDVAHAVSAHDVVVCHHVVYNVPRIAPFLRELDRHARRRVVVELSAAHPLASLNPLWLQFHGVTRPTAPTAADFLSVVAELGFTVTIDRWTANHEPAADHLERARLARIRLCLPETREPEVAEALASLGPAMTERVTVTWDPSTNAAGS
jgi:ubiquinone/menaquinone biosynthesis C-methylase UbiE